MMVATLDINGQGSIDSTLSVGDVALLTAAGFGGGPHSILAVGYDQNDGTPNPSMIEAKELDSNDQASFVITGPGTTDVYFYLDKGRPESMNIANGFDAAARAYPVSA